MRVLICTNEDIVGNVAANLLMPVLQLQGHEGHIMLSSKEMLPAAGNVHPSMAHLQQLEQIFPVTQLFPAMEAAGDEGEYLTFQQLSRFYNAPLWRVRSFKDEESVAMMRRIAPDLVLSLRFGCIFRQPHIETVRLGVWNFHSGLLPAYRGVMASFRAMMDGRKEMGITLHRITDEAIDVGEQIDRRTLMIQPKRSMLWHVLKLYPMAREMAAELLMKLNDDILPTPLPYVGTANYFGAPTVAEVNAFEAKGLRLFDLGEYRELLEYYGDTGAKLMPRLDGPALANVA